MSCKVSFTDDAYPAVELDAGSNLSEHLDVGNSPLLFGCRTGVCGTCLIRVERGADELSAADEDERELLEVLAPGDRQARLACQVDLRADICVAPHPEGGS